MRLNDKDLKEIAKLVDEGYGVNYIAFKYSYSKGNMEQIVGRYKRHGLEGILHGNSKTFTIDEKIKIINRHYAGESKKSLAIELNVRYSVIQQWISKYERLGYNGLIDNRGKPGVSKMGRPRKNQTKDVTNTTEAMAPVTDAEREELNRLRKENYRLQMEVDCLKKLQALVQERENRKMRKK